MISIEKKDLIELLNQAFDKGWQGYLDLKEEVVDSLVEKFLKNHIVEEKQCSFDWVAYQGDQGQPGYSSGTGLQGAQGSAGATGLRGNQGSSSFPNSYWASTSTTSDIFS